MQLLNNNIELLIPADRWFAAPGPLSRHFLPVIGEVANALHQVLRDSAPEILFRDPKQVLDMYYAYPMLVFQSSSPCPKRRTTYCYDVLDAESMTLFFFQASRKLSRNLLMHRAACVALDAADAAESYNPAAHREILKAVRLRNRQRKALNTMLVTEGHLLQELIALCGNCPAKHRAKKIGNFNKRWNLLLRRFCGAVDFTELGPVLLKAATDALNRALDRLDNSKQCDEPLDWAA